MFDVLIVPETLRRLLVTIWRFAVLIVPVRLRKLVATEWRFAAFIVPVKWEDDRLLWDLKVADFPPLESRLSEHHCFGFQLENWQPPKGFNQRIDIRYKLTGIDHISLVSLTPTPPPSTINNYVHNEPTHEWKSKPTNHHANNKPTNQPTTEPSNQPIYSMNI